MQTHGFKKGDMPPGERREILKEVGSKILSTAPEGWNRIIYTSASVVDMGNSSAVVEYEDGSTKTFRADAMIGIYLDKLRAGMYVECKGTWFSLECVITRPGKFKVHYNYDDDPGLTFATAKAFTNDLKYFPRDPENIPDWLHAKLREETEENGME
ncbi:hypothetical protein [Nocardiopsis sp. CC223A]|uniref:hypothetical protein n=1 Tax=Nocardiopsis sp. CC223A TaxID=3044051 RepID=UPI00278BF112|nr:hypothetical protein [Nocardiopsis sp. CC223A]